MLPVAFGLRLVSVVPAAVGSLRGLSFIQMDRFSALIETLKRHPIVVVVSLLVTLLGFVGIPGDLQDLAYWFAALVGFFGADWGRVLLVLVSLVALGWVTWDAWGTQFTKAVAGWRGAIEVVPSSPATLGIKGVGLERTFSLLVACSGRRERRQCRARLLAYGWFAADGHPVVLSQFAFMDSAGASPYLMWSEDEYVAEGDQRRTLDIACDGVGRRLTLAKLECLETGVAISPLTAGKAVPVLAPDHESPDVRIQAVFFAICVSSRRPARALHVLAELPVSFHDGVATISMTVRPLTGKEVRDLQGFERRGWPLPCRVPTNKGA